MRQIPSLRPRESTGPSLYAPDEPKSVFDSLDETCQLLDETEGQFFRERSIDIAGEYLCSSRDEYAKAKAVRQFMALIDLGPSGQPWFHMPAIGIFCDQRIIVIVMHDGMGARSNEGHLAAKNVQKLRNLVDARRADESADTGYARVSSSRLSDVAGIFKHGHAAKFEDGNARPP